MSSNDNPEVCAMGHQGKQPTPGCNCPPSRYHPTSRRPTNPDCPQHGEASTA